MGQQARVDGGTSEQDAEVVWVGDGAVDRVDSMPDDASIAGCGNGVAEAGEACDGVDFRGKGCSDFGFYEGELACREDCGAVQLAGCDGWCGDGVMNGPEVCDASDLGGMGCEGFGFYGGELLCSPGCDEVVLQGCYGFCGDGERNGPEECEGEDLGGTDCAGLGMGFIGGELLCDAGCRFDLSLCHRCGDGECGQGEDAQSCSADCAVVDVDAGYHHACALRADGAVLCWGQNREGQLGNGSTESSHTPIRVIGLGLARQVKTGSYFTCAGLLDGTVSCWGSAQSGALGDGNAQGQRSIPAPVVNLGDIREIALGGAHGCALADSGEVWCWGHNAFGEVGDGTTEDRPTPVQVPGLLGVRNIRAGQTLTCAWTEDGSVQCWGMVQPELSSLVPQEVQGVLDASDIAVGPLSACAVDGSGQVYCWGDNRYGQVGAGMPPDTYPTPVAVPGMNDALSIAVGGFHACALRTGGSVSCWGSDIMGQLGIGLRDTEPLPVETTLGGVVTRIVTGVATTCGILADGTMRCIGLNEQGELGSDPSWATRHVPVEVSSLQDVRDLAVGETHTCATLGDGSAWCWGRGREHQLGTGSAGANESVAVQVATSVGFTAIEAGYRHTCAITTGGELWCWGTGYAHDAFPEVEPPVALTPMQLGSFMGVAQYSIGLDHDCALTTGGSLHCWGNNSYGKLGDGTVVSRSTPTEVLGLAGATQVSMGEEHTCAIAGGGMVYCWGRNHVGQLGNGTTTFSTSPIPVAGLGPVASISSGRTHTLAATLSGEVYHWGQSMVWSTGPSGMDLVPSLVTGLSDVVEVASGLMHACARTSTGEVLCWGFGSLGVLGSGIHQGWTGPTPVTGIMDAVRLETSMKAQHTCAILSDGTARCWGRNVTGALGNGDPTTRLVPVEPDGL